MSNASDGGDDEDRDERDVPPDPAGDERAPRYLQLLAIPIIIILVLVIVGLIFLWRYSRPPGTEEQPQISGGAPVALLTQGPRAPGFVARTISGQNFTFPDDYRGKLVMLDFWATWCRPCVVEIPNLVEAYQAFHTRGLEIVGVTLDSIPPAEVAKFARSYNAVWPQVHEKAMEIAQRYQVVGIPSAFLIDGDSGRLLASGEALRGASLRATIQKYLQQKKGTGDGG